MLDYSHSHFICWTTATAISCVGLQPQPFHVLDYSHSHFMCWTTATATAISCVGLQPQPFHVLDYSHSHFMCWTTATAISCVGLQSQPFHVLDYSHFVLLLRSTSLCCVTSLAMAPCYRDCNSLHKFQPATSPPVSTSPGYAEYSQKLSYLFCSLFQPPVLKMITDWCEIVCVHCFAGVVILVDLLSYADDCCT